VVIGLFGFVDDPWEAWLRGRGILLERPPIRSRITPGEARQTKSGSEPNGTGGFPCFPLIVPGNVRFLCGAGAEVAAMVCGSD